MARLLAPGGRLGITDVAADRDRLPEELTGLTAWIACVADARPLAEYADLAASAGLRVLTTEPHTAALSRMIDQIEARLELLRMTARPRLEALGVDFGRVAPVLDATRNAVDEGTWTTCCWSRRSHATEPSACRARACSPGPVRPATSAWSPGASASTSASAGGPARWARWSSTSLHPARWSTPRRPRRTPNAARGRMAGEGADPRTWRGDGAGRAPHAGRRRTGGGDRGDRHLHPPARVGFRLVRGPVPYVRETFELEESPAGTRLTYTGEMSTDLGALGERWGDVVARSWVATVEQSLEAIRVESERRSAGNPARAMTRPCEHRTAGGGRRGRAGRPPTTCSASSPPAGGDRPRGRSCSSRRPCARSTRPGSIDAPGPR